jgi:hypothetical protein
MNVNMSGLGHRHIICLTKTLERLLWSTFTGQWLDTTELVRRAVRLEQWIFSRTSGSQRHWNARKDLRLNFAQLPHLVAKHLQICSS